MTDIFGSPDPIEQAHQIFGVPVSSNPSRTVYIPSKDRADNTRTPGTLSSAGIDNWFIVVEPQDAETYQETHGHHVLVLPENNRGLAYSRAWIKNHSRSKGESWHWQMDDDVKSFKVRQDDKNIKVNPQQVLVPIEEYCFEFDNIGIAGPIQDTFAFAQTKEVRFNKIVCGCLFVNNHTDALWEPGVIDDMDYSFQLLMDGWVTVSFSRGMFEVLPNGKTAGGNQHDMYKNRNQIVLNTTTKWADLLELDSNKDPWTYNYKQRMNKFNKLPE